MKKKGYVEGFWDRVNVVCARSGMSKQEITKRMGVDRKLLYGTDRANISALNLAKFCATIQSMIGRYGVYNIFEDWVRMIALAYANQIIFSQKREDEYLEIMKKYDEAERSKLCEMYAWLLEWSEEEMTDMLGYIYMHLELGSKAHGQFFTPYHICQMMAKMQKYDGKVLKVNEPSCGAGGNIIALAEALKEQGINYQQKMEVVCQDIDTKAVYMTYVQMCLYGIPAVVYQANTLSDPEGLQSVTGKLYSTGYLLKMA